MRAAPRITRSANVERDAEQQPPCITSIRPVADEVASFADRQAVEAVRRRPRSSSTARSPRDTASRMPTMLFFFPPLIGLCSFVSVQRASASRCSICSRAQVTRVLTARTRGASRSHRDAVSNIVAPDEHEPFTRTGSRLCNLAAMFVSTTAVNERIARPMRTRRGTDASRGSAQT